MMTGNMMMNNEFKYGIRIKDLKRKYFGDIVSEEVLCKDFNKEVQKEDKVIENILKEYK